MTDAESKAQAGRAAAEGLRGALVDYVGALHDAYLSTARERGADAGALPLAEQPFTVAVVAADRLHLVATPDPLPPVLGHERPVDAQAPPLRWQVRFFDASVVPTLARAPAGMPAGAPAGGGAPADGAPADGDPADVLGLLGVSRVLYHLVVGAHSTLTAHHALHAGAGLAGAHLGGTAGGGG